VAWAVPRASSGTLSALLLRVLHLVVLLAGLWASGARAGDDHVLVLDDAVPAHDAWHVATLLADPLGTLDAAGAAARRAEHQDPGRLKGSLGRRSGAVWLRVPLQVPQAARGRWLLEIDYPPLDRIDVYVLDGSRVEHVARLGDQVPRSQRLPSARAHVLPLELPPGSRRVLLLRVQTTGSMVVPMWLRSAADHQDRESTEQALQGLIAGMGLCLLIYSLAQWAILREAIFGLYALTLLGTVAFFAALSGVGAQHVWGGNEWLSLNGPPFFILVGVCGAFFFAMRALEVRRFSPHAARAMAACGAAAGLTAALFVAGFIDYAAAQSIGMLLGPVPLLLVLPVAVRRLGAGDHVGAGSRSGLARVAGLPPPPNWAGGPGNEHPSGQGQRFPRMAAVYMLAGWVAYSLGVLTIVGLLSGWLPVNFWTLHGFQFASMLEMAMWVLVLGERVRAIRRTAIRVGNERDRLHGLAYADVLTGLHNRRALQDVAPALLSQLPTGRCAALFLLDLDGFKPVNDSLGHDAGDQLLVAVAQRLQNQARDGDLACRLGGDEFVVVVDRLADAEEAAAMGGRLLQAFDEPFQVQGQACRVGATIGYALAPQDDSDLAALLKRADAAMYAGKQASRRCIRRGAPTAGVGGV
jgi:diguanylate cyclase